MNGVWLASFVVLWLIVLVLAFLLAGHFASSASSSYGSVTTLGR